MASSVKFDPLRYFPYELWVKCVQLYAREQPEGPLPLLAVSLAWQSHLLGTPELWATIYLDGGHDEHCRAESFFHLSQSLPIELVLDKKSRAMEMLIKHSDRIKSLIFYTSSSGGLFTTADILFISKKIDSHQYQALLHIIVQAPRDVLVLIPPRLIAACLALIGIYGASIQQDTIPYLSESTTCLGIVGNGILPKGIGDQLEVLRVRCIPSEKQEKARPEYFTVPSTHLTHFELHYGVHNNKGALEAKLPFGSGTQYLAPIQAFVSIPHYGLKVLRLAMPWYDISRLVPFLSTCKQLRELELTLDHAWPGPQHIPPLTINDIGHVRKLSLYTAPRRERSQPQFVINLQRAIRLFVDGDALGRLEELRIGLRDRENFNSALIGLLSTAKNITELHLVDSPLAGSNKDLPKILLNRLHTLFVGNENTLEYLEVPNLVCLAITGTVSEMYRESQIPDTSADTLECITVPAFLFYQWNDAIPKSRSGGDTFPRLVTLRLTAEDFDRDSLVAPNFSHLQSITLEDKIYRSDFSRQITGDSLVNHFMLEILLSPENCPSLHTIRTTKYPNWALANTLFYRRNALKTVQPILSLWLPGYPQIKILHLTCQALNAFEQGSSARINAISKADKIIRWRWATDFFRRQACQNCIMSGYISCPSNQKQRELSASPLVVDLLDLDTAAMSARRIDAFTFYEWREYQNNNVHSGILSDEDSDTVDMTTSQFEKFTRHKWRSYLEDTVISTILVDDHDTEICRRHDRRNLVQLGAHTLAELSCPVF